MIRDGVVEALREMGISQEIVRQLPELSPDIEGLLVYGSQARGDAVLGSDLDLLAIVPSARATSSSGDVSISYYTLKQLSTGIGTLFGAHLNRDAKVIWDRSGRLSEAVQCMGEVDTARLLERARRMSTLFTTPEWDLPKYLPGFLRQARYLLRSCLYAQAIADNRPCFSVREIADRQGDRKLANLLASRQEAAPSIVDLEECLFRLRGILGEFSPSLHGSLEATIVNEWGNASDVLSAAFMALGTTGAGSVYAEVEKILL